MKHKTLLKKIAFAVTLFCCTNVFSQTSPVVIGTITAGKSVIITYDVAANSGTSVSHQVSVTGTNFQPFSTNDPKTATGNDATVTAISNNYYPKTSATDLSQVSHWTTDVNGTLGVTPANFTSAGRVFNVNRAATVINPLTISGGSNFTLSTASGLVFGPLSTFTIGASSTADFGGNPVTFQSTSAGTAALGTVTGTLNNASQVTVERFVNNGLKGAWRLMTAPLKTTAGSVFVWDSWQNAGVNTGGVGTLVTGPGYTNGSDGIDALSQGHSLKTFDHTVGQSFINITNTKSTPLFNTTGNKSYFIFINGDRSSSTASPNITTLKAKGTLQTGDITFNTASANAGDVTLVGNPYASPIDLKLFRDGNSGSNTSVDVANVKSNYYYWDPYMTGTYGVGGYVTVSYDKDGLNETIVPQTGVAGATHTRFLQSGQAMFLERRVAAGGTASVTFKENQKATTDVPGIFRTTAGTEKLDITLNVVPPAASPVLLDGIAAVFNSDYASAVDDYDASKFYNVGEGIALKRNSTDLSIERRNSITDKDTLFLNMRNMVEGQNYQFKFTPEFTAPGLMAFLQDSYQPGVNKPVSLTSPSSIDFAVTSNTATSAAERFRIVFSTAGPLPLTLTNVKAYQQNANVAVEWKTENESGVKEYEVKKSLNGTSFSKTNTTTALNTISSSYRWLDQNPATGYNYYRIRSLAVTGESKLSSIVKVYIGKGLQGIAVYPNPVRDGVVSVQFTNMEKGNYSLRLINHLGQAVFSKQIQHAGGSANETIELDKNIARGNYTMEVTTPANSRITERIIL